MRPIDSAVHGRVSAWLADIEDWNSNDADVFMAVLASNTPVNNEALHAEKAAS